LTYRRQVDKLQGLKNLRRKHVTERSQRGDTVQDVICYNLFTCARSCTGPLDWSVVPSKGETFAVATFRSKHTFHGEGVTTMTNQN